MNILEFKSFLLGSDYNQAKEDQQKVIDSEVDFLLEKKERLNQNINLILNNSENEYYIISELDIEQDLVVIENGEF